MAGQLRIEVRTEEPDDGSAPYSWWLLIAANNRTECASEVFDGPEHRRVATRAAERMAGRIGVPVRLA